ncbi:hypothetical protein [Hwanghaeella sp.]|uniref:hypothetical protein n=1 Tax=Hwanghaeella sp. TaxID=2605943 RepID=UPI003CCC1DD5
MREREGKKGWVYRTYPLGEDAAELGTAGPVFDLWRAKCDMPHLPAWRDFDFGEFVGWHANLILYEVKTEPFDLLYRICGGGAAHVYGKDLTGQTMRSGAEGIQEDIDLAFYQEMADERRYGTCQGPAYWRGRLFLQHAFLCLPLSEDGDRVTHFLTVLHLETLDKLR